MNYPVDPTEHTMTDAILHALVEAGWLARQPAVRKDIPAYRVTMKGVYVNKTQGLHARFFRSVGGKTKTYHVATGQPGVFTRAEEERLHELWKVATAAWDRAREDGAL
jgi:hypothetical protein